MLRSTTFNAAKRVRFSSKLVASPSEKQTIYALSTPPGKGGIGVIRISGPDALDVYSKMVRVGLKGKQRERAPEPWRMHRCSIVHPKDEQVLDEGMAVFFQGKFYSTDPLYTQLISDQHLTRTPQSIHSNCTLIPAAPSSPLCSPRFLCSPLSVLRFRESSPNARYSAGDWTLRRWKVSRILLTQKQRNREKLL